MERRRRFIFSGVPTEQNSMSSGGEELSSSSGMSETGEDIGLTKTSSRSHKHLLETLGFESGSNFSSTEVSEEWLCKYSDQLFSNNSSEVASMSNESTFRNESIIGNGTNSLEQEHRAWCNRSFDKILCWPETPEGTSALLPCFAQLNGVHYDTSGTVSRVCQKGGIWQNVSDYSQCQPLGNQQDAESHILGVTIHVYFFGYCLSLAALIVAMIIFLAFKRQMPWSTSKARKLFQVSEAPEQTKFMDEILSDRHSRSVVHCEAKELRCLRNKIHIQLIITYILAAVLWIITNFTSMSTTMSQKDSVSSQVSCVTFILLHYFHLTNFFWMFVEGLYLYVLVVQTFTAENIRLRVYTLIGWGLPFLVVVGWSIVKWLTTPLPSESIIPTDPEWNVPCVWIVENVFDWFYKVPALFVLCANIVFLFRIMWVLITKLRSATNPETQQSRKAAKALVVLMPLLGITYVFVLAVPRKLPAYEHIRALLISTQGFLVALLYCFLNGEVRMVLRHRWSRIRSSGCPFNLGRCCGWDSGRRRHLQNVRDWSPSCRTESIRLYTPAFDAPEKGESTINEQCTTMTNLHGGSSSINGNFGIQSLSASTVKRLSVLSNSFNSQKIHDLPENNIHV